MVLVKQSLILILLTMIGCQASAEFEATTSDPDHYRASMRYEFHEGDQRNQSWTGIEIDLETEDRKIPLQYTLNLESNAQAQQLLDKALSGTTVRTSLEVFTQEDPNVLAQMHLQVDPIEDDAHDQVRLHLSGSIRFSRFGLDETETPIVVVYFDHDVVRPAVQ